MQLNGLLFRLQRLCAIALAAVAVPVAAEDGVAAPDGSQTFSLTLLHDKAQPTWSDIDISRGVPLMQFLVNGQSVCGVIDTGSDRTIVDIDFARAQDLTVLASDWQGKSASGPIDVARVLSVPVEVPGQFRFEAELAGIDIPDIACPNGGNLTFILGQEILKFLAVGIDPSRKKVVLVQSGGLNPRDNRWVKYDWVDGLMEGTVNGHPARLRVDTGSNSLLLVPANRFENLFVDLELEDLGRSTDASGPKNNLGIPDISVRLGPVTATSNAIRIAESAGPEDANLGYTFFFQTVTIFDAGQNLIAIQLPQVEK